MLCPFSVVQAGAENFRVAIGLLVMMYPILCKVRYESLHKLLAHRDMWKQIAFSLFINWVVAPFLMASPLSNPIVSLSDIFSNT